MASPVTPLNFQNFQFKEIAIDTLPGFTQENFKDASVAWNRSAERLKQLPETASIGLGGLRRDWDRVLSLSVDDADFSHFLRSQFKVYQLIYEGHTQGLFTGYFEPCLKASPVPHPDFPYPVYARPHDLIVIEDLGHFHKALAGYRIAGTLHGKTLKPYFTRRELSEGILKDKGYEIAWVQDQADLFFMHVQGSGRIDFEEDWLRLGYDGTNGHLYTSIGKYMVDQGFLLKEEATMEGIKAWLRANPAHINDVLHQNESFVFFKNLGAQEGPIGRQGSVLTPQRSLAVDPRVIPMGAPLWLAAEPPHLLKKPLHQFIVAQDVGGAIKGPIRGDFYWGTGDEAGALAGCMQSRGSLYLLLPKTLSFKGFCP